MRSIAALCLLATGCATQPVQLVPLTSNPTPREQALAICRSEARATAAAASSQAQANIAAQNAQVTGYNCTTNAYGSYGYRSYDTNCTPRTGGPTTTGAAVAQALTPSIAGTNAGNAAFEGCLARNGWGLSRR